MTVLAQILIRAQTSAGQYSGGRLHAWILAEGFARLGHAVTFWGDALPVFAADFADYPHHDRVRFHGGGQPPAGPFQLVLVVPHTGQPMWFYPQALAVAARDSARVVLLNFESGNWFNALSPEPRDLRLWDGWRQIARSADVILSSARESTRYAREFYTDTPPGCEFVEVPPAINSRMADLAVAQPEHQVICINRFTRGSAHKGGGDLLEILGPHFAGHTLALLIGSGGMDAALQARFEVECQKYGARLRLLSRITDLEKFTEIKKSRLLVFLSTFEGFGLPPVEALYCGVPCVAYDLPVLHEVGGPGIRFVPVGDKSALRSAVAELLTHPLPTAHLRAVVEQTVGFEGFCNNLNRVFLPVLGRGRRKFSAAQRLCWQIQTISGKSCEQIQRVARIWKDKIRTRLTRLYRSLIAGR